ncbi:MAG: metallophosphoesterase family protein [Desulfocapsa sp.]|nr:metallophosphoesterase family protein [Desulfocapsa sp.]
MKILLLSDIHANYPALKAIINYFSEEHFDAIYNCGDSLVYGPFPNETLRWLKENNVHSIVGNTDRKVIKLIKGKTFKKPSKEEKRIMYDWTANQLTSSSKAYLLTLKKSKQIHLADRTIGIFHGSPEHPNEFLFPDTSTKRFEELAAFCQNDIILFGHSHTAFHKKVKNTHFINPGSVGRMFDSNPEASCSILTIDKAHINIKFHRVPWQISKTIEALKYHKLPAIYQSMYTLGRKLN